MKMPEDKASIKYVVWHQRDNDGHVEAVFAAPRETLYTSMHRHAQYLATTAKDNVEVEIDDSDELAIFAEFYQPAQSENEEGDTENVALIPGVPSQPFEKIHVASKEGFKLLDVEEVWKSYSEVPDEFDSNVFNNSNRE
jgi:hypothetical protein